MANITNTENFLRRTQMLRWCHLDLSEGSCKGRSMYCSSRRLLRHSRSIVLNSKEISTLLCLWNEERLKWYWNIVWRCGEGLFLSICDLLFSRQIDYMRDQATWERNVFLSIIFLKLSNVRGLVPIFFCLLFNPIYCHGSPSHDIFLKLGSHPQ